ncbi:MAG: TrmH family RNA methyltransferase [Anaerolineae bacterium]
MITSTANEKVKYARSLLRRRVRQQERHFVIEGARLIQEALRAGVQPALVFYVRAWAEDPDKGRLLASLTTNSFLVSEGVMKFLSPTVTPQGLLAVLPFVEIPLPHELSLVLVVDGLRDPGNLGTILRSAEAAGVDEVITTHGTVDLYNPKVVRGAMGAHFRLPVATDQSWSEIEEKLKGWPVVLADPGAAKPYYEVDWTVPTALIIGGEAYGPGAEATRLADAAVTIPMHGATESLNAAMAASIILFEAARQRRSVLS